MKTLNKSGKHKIIKEIIGILVSDEALPSDRYTGACTSGAPDSTANRSYGYGFIPGVLPSTLAGPRSLRALVQNRSRRFCRCKAALSNTPDAQSSGISMKYPG